MTWVDWIIVLSLLLSVAGGFAQGFFRSVFSLGGLVLGLALAAWNYGRVAALMLPFLRIQQVANVIGFVAIVAVVTVVANLLGSILAKALHKIGLGCLDRLAGAAFGLFQGALLVTLCVLVTIAFFPKAHWLVEAKLPKYFFGACHLSTHVTPTDLAERVRKGLRMLEEESPRWMHSEAEHS